MMGLRYFGFLFVFGISQIQSTPLFVIPQEGKVKQSPANEPLIVFIDAGRNHEDVLDIIDNEAYEVTDDDDNDPKEDAKYMFYNYLRMSPTDAVDPELKKQKELLRTALRNRCNKVLRCRRECGSSEEEVKKKYCPKNCKDIFDSFNLCEPPKKKKPDHCRRPKCGKTLPPSWRFK